MRAPLFQVDAFTTRRFAGNPAAVVLLPAFPEDAVLQAIAAENNLAETAFLVPHGNDFRLRWFTPAVEVPLCGHATLASAAVLMERVKPGLQQVVFHTLSGALTVHRLGDRYCMDFPARSSTRITAPAALVTALGTTPLETYANEFSYLAVFDAAHVVRQLRPDLAALAALDRGSVIVTAPGDQDYDCVSRFFAPAKGIPEDPVTGSAHCMLAPFWAAQLGRHTLRAHQASPRGGDLLCRVVGERVELEGHCVFYLEGHIEY